MATIPERPLAFILDNCTSASDMDFKLMADRTRYLKEDPKGVSEMCQIMEDMRDQTAKETTINFAKKMLADGMLTLEKIAEYTGLPFEEVKVLKAEQTP